MKEVEITFDIVGTICQTVQLNDPYTVEDIKSGLLVTSVGSNGTVLEIPSLKVVGKVISQEIVDAEYNFDLNDEEDGL